MLTPHASRKIASLSACRPKTSWRPTNVTLIDGLRFCVGQGGDRGPGGVCRENGRILLANSEVPKFVYPTCLLGRQKSLGNLRKKKYC